MLLDVGIRKINTQYGFKISTYTEGNKMANGSVLSLYTKTNLPISNTNNSNIKRSHLRFIIKYIKTNTTKNNNSRRYISSIFAWA